VTTDIDGFDQGEPEARLAAMGSWSWSERLALVGLAVISSGVVLPWGHDATGQARQLVHHEHVGWLGACLIVVAIAVPAHLTGKHSVAVTFVVTGLAGAGVALLTFLVTGPGGDPLPLLVPGRLAITAGGMSLVVAVLGRVCRPDAERPAANLDALAAAVKRRDRRETDRWIAVAGLGLAGIALSAPLSQHTAGSSLFWAALVVGVVPLAVAKLRPWTSRTAAGGVTLAVTALLIVRSWFALMAGDGDSVALWTLFWAFVTTSAACAPLNELDSEPLMTRDRPIKSPWLKT
jgi:hypothetical protein